MILKRIFGGTQPPPSLVHLKLEGRGIEHEVDHENLRVWRTAEGDAVGVYYFNLPPDLPSGQLSEHDFLDAYSARAQSEGVGVVELEICTVAGYRALGSIIKVPQQPSGLTYIGAFTLPFRDHSFVVKIQCEEGGMTGVREAVLMDSALAAGKVRIGDNGTIEGEWNPDDTRYDDQFPDHPLTRARRWMPRIQSGVSVNEDLALLPKFAWPG